MTSQEAAPAAERPAVPVTALPARTAPGWFARGQGLLGRHLSTRWKLTLWYAAFYIVTLAAVGVALPPLVAWETNRVVDAGLRQTSRQIAARVASARYTAAPGGTTPLCSQGANWFCLRVQGTLTSYSARVTHPGQFEGADILIPPLQLPVSIYPSSLPRGLAGPEMLYIAATISEGKSRFHTVTFRGEQVRIYFTPLDVPPSLRRRGISGVLEVFQIEAAYSQTNQAIELILLGLALLVLVIAPLSGWWIARAALRPIRRISRTVHSIGGSGDMSRRVHFTGPRDEIGQLAETFDAMMDRLEQMFETQKRFVADASHELRTPLTTIRGNADLMRIAPPEDQAACLAAIRKESERMSRLVNDLLLLAEADIDQQPLEKRRVELDGLLDEVYRSALLLAGDQVAVLLEENQELVVDADPDRIKQVLLNLTDNALKFTPAGGTLTLRSRRRGDFAEIDVADTGVGIPPDEQEAIFRRFYRLDRARSTAGSGLGLSISAWIIQSHGGTIDVRSRLGEGSTFTIRLPLPTASPNRATQAHDSTAQTLKRSRS